MAESQILRLGCAGLVADPGPFSGVPDGAMVEAKNVTYRRPGAVESRDSFVLTDDSALSASSIPYGVHVFDDGSTQSVHWCGDSGAGAIWRKDGTTTIGGGFSFAQYKSHHASYRGRGFFTAQQGVAVLDGNSDTTARLAGVPRGPGFLTTVTAWASQWLAQDEVVGYRTCVARSLNGTIARGAPSEIRYVCNDQRVALGGSYVSLRVYITSDIVAGDYVEIYRTPEVTGTFYAGAYTIGSPSDEGTLRASILITSAIVAAGYFDFDDKSSSGEYSGPYLYTNASQEGLLLGNERPNYARDVDVYNGMMFYAGQRSPQRVTLTITGTGAQEDLVTTSAKAAPDKSRRLCGYEGTGNTTIGSTTVALAAGEAAFLTVGMYVAEGAGTVNPETGTATIPANTQIVSINTGANTIVISNQAGATAAVTLQYFDFIEVDDGTTKRRLYTRFGYNVPEPFPTTASTFTNFFGGTSSWHIAYAAVVPNRCSSGGAADIERAWDASYGTSSFRVAAVSAGTKSNETVLLRIERTDASLGSFTVRSSKPLAFDQYVDSVTGITSSQEGTPGRLAWSKPFEPEAVPLPYYADVGDPTAPIYRIAPTQDALYILKGDGIFRAYGDTPENLIIQPVDLTARLNDYSPNMVTRYGPCVYAWTTRGIVEVGTAGVRNIDGPIYNQANFPVGERFNTTDGWAYSSQVGRIVVFGYRTDRWATGQNVWVYHPELGTWATWTFRRSIYAASSVSGGTVAGRPYPTIAFARGFAQSSIIGNVTVGSLSPVYKGGDALSITPSVVSGTSIQIPAGTLWTPAVGDAIYNATQQKTAWVTAVSSATAFTIDRDIGLFAATPYTVFEACESRVTWTAIAAGNPGAEKHFTDSILLFTFLRYGRTFTERYQGYRNPTVVTNDVTYDSATTEFQFGRPYARRGHVPYGPGRDWALRFGFSQTQGGAYFSLDGAALSYSMTGSRL